jgi:hypothetical protein
MSKIKSTLSKSLPAIIVSVMFTTAIIYAAWQEPKSAPPNDNVPAPINVGTSTQSFLGHKTLNVRDGAIPNGGVLSINGGLGVLGVFQATGGSGQNVFNVINDKVGIGTVNPLYKLQIGAWNSNTSTVSIMSNLNQEASLMFGYSGYYNLWKIGRPANSDSLVIQRMDGGDAVRFGYTSKVINFNSNLLYIDGGNSKIGIGTPNPTQKLDVVGQIHATGDICTDAGGGKCLSSGGSSDGGKGIEIIAVHSQTPAIPNCPAGWEKLWDGYSLAASYLHPGYGAFNDLGSSGSCVEEFRPIPFIECYSPGQCDFFTSNNLSMWLSANTSDSITNPGSIIGTSTILPHISRCSVCKKPAKIVVRHSLSTTVPSCPIGSNKLWDGYSLHAMNLASSYSSPQDLKSPGSCLRLFRPIPFIECQTPNQCDFWTDGDLSMWLTTYASTTDVDMRNTRAFPPGISTFSPYISRCVVCEY